MIYRAWIVSHKQFTKTPLVLLARLDANHGYYSPPPAAVQRDKAVRNYLQTGRASDRQPKGRGEALIQEPPLRRLMIGLLWRGRP